MKANHNAAKNSQLSPKVVSSTTKIVKWKQITTPHNGSYIVIGCFQYDKDSKMKANHNETNEPYPNDWVVSSTTKIVKWKQITTQSAGAYLRICCFQYDKDSKMKANHNVSVGLTHEREVVSSTTKIVKWKQITTTVAGVPSYSMLFPVRQR